MLHFVGDGDQKKFTKNPCHFSMQNSQANTEKIFTKFFWRAGKVMNVACQLLFGWRMVSKLRVLFVEKVFPSCRLVKCFFMVPPCGFLFLRFCGDCVLKCDN